MSVTRTHLADGPHQQASLPAVMEEPSGEMETVVEDQSRTEPEPLEEDFKKPTVHLAPSLTCKRSNSHAPLKPTGPEDDNTLETPSEISPEPVSDRQPVRKARVGPVKAPPAGTFPPLPYTEPPWGGSDPDSQYALEILKNGSIVDTFPLTHRSYFVVGRLPVCDVSLEHPSISRYHCVIQYRGEGEEEGVRGFYVHDLGSTHGTVVNKNKIPPRTYVRLRVGHVIKFGGSTRLFVLQGPECDEEEESELTVTELREQARKHKEDVERRMMGEGPDDQDQEEEEEENKTRSRTRASNDESGCSWGMAEEAAPEEDENEENPFSTEFHEDQEAAYLKDPKKALQGFYDREGEELEFEYEDQNHGAWLCRIKLPVDDALGRQLVAEVTHTGKKKEAAVQCCLEACRMLEARGLLRQEAVSRKRKKKNWEDEDYYDSDDDTFLDRTGTVEKKRRERMKKAGKIEERPDTYESLVAKLSSVEKELRETQTKLMAAKGGSTASSADDSLEVFMKAVKCEEGVDAVERRKLHMHVAELRKDAERLRKLVEMTRPAQMPSLVPCGSGKPTKTLPLFGAMKGGSKFKLKTGTLGKLPPKRAELPSELFIMKEPPAGPEEEEEEEDDSTSKDSASSVQSKDDRKQEVGAQDDEQNTEQNPELNPEQSVETCTSTKATPSPAPRGPRAPKESKAVSTGEPGSNPSNKKKVLGPRRPPVTPSGPYPEDDPDYSVWMPPSGQTGDGRTHLNDKYGY